MYIKKRLAYQRRYERANGAIQTLSNGETFPRSDDWSTPPMDFPLKERNKHCPKPFWCNEHHKWERET